jgi:predicted nucleic acid-binding protein
MRPVFLDTVGLIALWDTDDQWHAAANAACQGMVSQRRTTVTTSFILLECGNTAARRSFRSDVCSLRRGLELRNELIVPTEHDWQAAWAAYERGDAAHAGIVDQISFVVMRRLGITEAFTNDRHFQAAGFTTLF